MNGGADEDGCHGNDGCFYGDNGCHGDIENYVCGVIVMIVVMVK
jgi:hypothetical protein